ncbi:hypothetical protein MCOR25_008253 [Pyricularia grisea]|uniref:Uncharacterized protein n=1 Tax=Pyricularia grisea TaxID=148305 RepID=A0A6P8BFI0_PYRGI|nr:uncharacterized protein PgNI_01491 [Pyricularia grisea]KAI6355268.1 hypothetical protein MCOR25_008253 [Pyricularia grisea]TLD15389.1 hypothetical protein PgNI_01491 [Pyricularia grisea]
MHSSSILLLATAALAPFVAGTELKINSKDIPSACTETCADIQELSESCYNSRDKNNSEKSEANCVCTNTEFEVGASSVACQQCFASQKATSAQRENIDRIVKTCNFSNSTLSRSAGNMPTMTFKGPWGTGLVPTCMPVTVTVTVTVGDNYTAPYKTSTASSSTKTSPSSTWPSGTTGTTGNATRPGTPLPTAGASSINPGFQLAALAAFVYMLA